MARKKRKGEPKLSPHGGRPPRKASRKLWRLKEKIDRCVTDRVHYEHKRQRLQRRFDALVARTGAEPRRPNALMHGAGAGFGSAVPREAPKAAPAEASGVRSGAVLASVMSWALAGATMMRRRAG